MSNYELKLEYVKENYDEELLEMWHNNHTACGEDRCLDAGGGVTTEDDYDMYEKEGLAKEYYKENKKEVDEQYNFDNGFCQEFSVAKQNFIEAFTKVGK